MIKKWGEPLFFFVFLFFLCTVHLLLVIRIAGIGPANDGLVVGNDSIPDLLLLLGGRRRHSGLGDGGLGSALGPGAGLVQFARLGNPRPADLLGFLVRFGVRRDLKPVFGSHRPAVPPSVGSLLGQLPVAPARCRRRTSCLPTIATASRDVLDMGSPLLLPAVFAPAAVHAVGVLLSFLGDEFGAGDDTALLNRVTDLVAVPAFLLSTLTGFGAESVRFAGHVVEFFEFL